MKFIFSCIFFASICCGYAQNNPPPPPPFPPADQYDSIVSKDKDKVYDLVAIQVAPKFQGGDQELYKFLAKNIIYPAVAKENGFQGKVFLSFIIDETGAVTNTEVYKNAPISKEILDLYANDEKQLERFRTMSAELGQEALRVIRLMPNWTPGMQNDKAVKTRFLLPINFKLQ